jgi:hypothetical protein
MMKIAQRAWWQTVLAVAFVASVPAQSSDPPFVIDPARPYVYLQFDHVGPISSELKDEGVTGLWLRLKNNSRMAIALRCIGANADGSSNVSDEVIANEPGIVITSDVDEPAKERPKLSKAKPPRGNSFEVSGVCRIEPGKSLLIQFPRNHVSSTWFLRVRVALEVNRSSVAVGPWTILDFNEYEIPKDQRIPAK